MRQALKEQVESSYKTDEWLERSGLKLTDSLKCGGVSIALMWAIAADYMIPEDFGDIDNQEVRTLLLRQYCRKRHNGDFAGFIRDGGGRVVLSGQVSDYEHGEILEFIWNNQKVYYLKLINRTVEPGSETLTEEQRVKNGLTKDGYKIYVLGIPVDDYKSVRDAVAWTFYAEKNKEGRFVFKYPKMIDIGNGKVLKIQEELDSSDENVIMGHQGDIFFVRIGTMTVVEGTFNGKLDYTREIGYYPIYEY